MRQDSPIATEEDKKEHMQSILSALNDRMNRIRRTRDIYDAILKMSPDELASAVAVAAKLPKKYHYEVLQPLVARWAESDPRAAAEFALSFDLKQQGSLVSEVAISWADADPRTAKEWALSLPPGRLRDTAISSVASRSAQRDVAGALSWIAQLPEGKSKQQAQREVAFQWSRTDPRAAVDYIMKNQPPSVQDRDYSYISLIQTWVQKDSQQALEWTRQLADEKMRGVVLEGIIGVLAAQEPQRAAGLLAEFPTDRRLSATTTVAKVWARSDPDQAAAWALGLPEDNVSANAMGNIVGVIAENDLAKATSLLEQLPPGASRDMAVGNFTFRAMEIDPANAAALAASISSETMRSHYIQEVVVLWLRRDKDAATRWILQTNSLNEKTKERLLPKN